MIVVPDEEQPETIMCAMIAYEAGGMTVTEEMYNMERVPSEIGLNRVVLEYFDSGSGEDYEYGFDVLSAVKV